MAKKPKEPTWWSTSANGKTSSGGSAKKKASSGCPRVGALVGGVVLAHIVLLLGLLGIF